MMYIAGNIGGKEIGQFGSGANEFKTWKYLVGFDLTS